MRKSDCIYAADCFSNCGICSIYQSNKIRPRLNIVMALVELWQSEISDLKRNVINYIAQSTLTEEEIGLFEFEIQQRGV